MAKRSRGMALPPVDASPEEVAKALFEPQLQLRREQGRARSRFLGETLTITVPEGSEVHRWLEAQETARRQAAEAKSE